MLKHIDDEALYDQEIAKGTVLVDFYADWCGPCKMLAPHIEQLSEELPEVTFIKVNVDHAPRLAARYQVYSIPTILVFKDGELVDKKVGYAPKEALGKLVA